MKKITCSLGADEVASRSTSVRAVSSSETRKSTKGRPKSSSRSPDASRNPNVFLYQSRAAPRFLTSITQLSEIQNGCFSHIVSALCSGYFDQLRDANENPNSYRVLRFQATGHKLNIYILFLANHTGSGSVLHYNHGRRCVRVKLRNRRIDYRAHHIVFTFVGRAKFSRPLLAQNHRSHLFGRLPR